MITQPAPNLALPIALALLACWGFDEESLVCAPEPDDVVDASGGVVDALDVVFLDEEEL